MARLVLLALVLFALAVGLLDLSARGAFAAPPGPPVAVAGAGPLLRVVPSPLRGAAGRGRVAVVVRAPGAETRRLSGALEAEGIRATFALSALDVLADRTLPAFVTGHGHEVAFAGYADADATRLPEPIWIANESLGRRILERASEREVRLYLPGRLLGGELDATALETARRAETAGLLPLLPAPAPARRDDLDGLIVVRRAADLDALRGALARARTSGVTLVAASALAGIGSEPLPLGARIAGGAAFAAFDLWRSLADLVVALAGAATLLMLLRLVVVAILATAQARRPDVAGGDVPMVAVLVAAYNEEVVIGTCVRSILASDVEGLQVVVVDDGSTDATAARASEAAAGDERLRVVRQPNGGKASALNTALARTDAAVVVVMDADSLLEREALRRLVAPFADQAVGAVAGNVKVGNRSSWLGALQHLEYVVGINLDRRFFDLVNAVSIVPGALGGFRREAIVRAGGFPRDTLAEDADLTVAIGMYGYQVRTVADARAWTEVPATWRALWKQRYRWSYGTLQVLWKHRDAPFRWRATNVGRLGIPYLIVFGYLLPLLAPAIDVTLLYGLVVGPQVPLLAAFGVFTILQTLAAALALRLDGEPAWHAGAVLGYQLGYRQMLFAVIASSLWAAFAGLPVGWGKLVRRGLLPRPG
ncbi:MAG: glycosyltransferase family 2 protein [Chloroflexi bacterium]|nr:MAG: glycosyltransferase family 2 protein [Chloroflexota bacterium]